MTRKCFFHTQRSILHFAASLSPQYFVDTPEKYFDLFFSSCTEMCTFDEIFFYNRSSLNLIFFIPIFPCDAIYLRYLLAFSHLQCKKYTK